MKPDEVRVKVTVTVTTANGTTRRSSTVDRIDEGDITNQRLTNWVSSEAPALLRAALREVDR